jgi:hypothetical protein
MSPEEKTIAAEERAKVAAAAAHERLLDAEDEAIELIESVWPRISEDDRRKFDYLALRIPKAKPEDVQYLRATRELHFRKYRAYIPKEAECQIESPQEQST